MWTVRLDADRLMPCSDLVSQLSGSVAGGVVGFAAAYILARRQRRWDTDDATAAARTALIQAARVPLELVRDETRSASLG